MTTVLIIATAALYYATKPWHRMFWAAVGMGDE